MARVGLTPEGIRRELIRFVQNGGNVLQVKEKRQEWKNERDFYYKAIVPMPGLFKRGLFIEMELFDADLDLPEVRLVSAHEQQ